MPAAFDFLITRNIVDRVFEDTSRDFPFLKNNKKAYKASRLVAAVGHALNRAFLKSPFQRLERFVYLGIAIIIFDNICDVGDGSSMPLIMWLKEKINPERNKMLNKMIDNVVYWQKQSLKQKEEISKEEIWEIIKNKGGYTGLVLLYVFEDKPTKVLKKAAYHCGVMVQLIDDWMDVDEDKKEGVKTLFTEGYLNTKDLFDYVGNVIANYAWHPQIGMMMLEIPSIFLIGTPKDTRGG